MTSEQLDERLADLSTKKREWTTEDYFAVLEAYKQADQATKDQVRAMLRTRDRKVTACQRLPSDLPAKNSSGNQHKDKLR